MMYEQLKRFIRHNIQVSDDVLNEIVKHFKPLSVKKSAVLLSQSEVCHNFYFVHTGCLRTYYLTQQGNEKTRYIATEGTVITSLTSFISLQPSFEFIDALENADLLVISRVNFFRLVKDVREWAEFYRRLLEFAYIYQNKKIENLVTLSAGERYNLVIKEHPAYTQRLSNKILASYLDVTQESLSRLKSR